MRDDLRDIFVSGSISRHGDKGTFCYEHIPNDVMESLGEDFVDTWSPSDGGWTMDVKCDVCGLLLAKKDKNSIEEEEL